MQIFLDILLMLVGIVLLVKGADFFVEGSSNIARKFHIPSFVIGLTLVSIGTSLPEASVSVISAINGKSDLSFGNVIGSNIFNCLVVIGACALVTPLAVKKSMARFDIPFLLAIIGIVALEAFLFTPYVLTWYEALILFILFIFYIGFTLYRSKDEKDEENTEEIKEKPMWLNIIFVIGGLLGIIFGGDLVVDRASNLAYSFGMSELLVGLTIISIGTSLPELVISLVAVFKRQNDIAIGNAIGSSILNIIFILGLSGLINPITLQPLSYIDVIAMASAVIFIFIFVFKNFKINRYQGAILLAIYIAYFTYIIIRK